MYSRGNRMEWSLAHMNKWPLNKEIFSPRTTTNMYKTYCSVNDSLLKLLFLHLVRSFFDRLVLAAGQFLACNLQSNT